MKFIDLKPLSVQRLKAYRKSIIRKISGYEVCDCGCGGCDNRLNESKDDPNYINLSIIRERVNKELARKQKAEQKKNPAHVPTVKETEKL